MITTVKQPSTRERTGSQARQMPQAQLLQNPENLLTRPSSTYSYRERRELRKQPAYALARELMPGPILAANWTISPSNIWKAENGQEVPEEWVTHIRKDLMGIRDDLLTATIKGLMDFGWVPFEQVFEQESDGSYHLVKLKALLQDYTDIKITKKGAFAGFVQNSWTGSAESTGIQRVRVPKYKSLLFSINVEGTNWYGEGRLDAAAESIESWNDADDGAARYDNKVAGSHWVIYYPTGKTEVSGVETDNYELAADLLANVESSGGFILPSTISNIIEDMDKAETGWKVEALSDAQARQHSFVARLEYLDKCVVRAAGYPERAILEGNFGTKAESGVHSNIAGSAQDVLHRYLVAVLNENSVDQLLYWNYGPEAVGAVRINPAPITNVQQDFLNDVYKMMMNNQVIVGEEYNQINKPALRDKVSIPHHNEDTQVSSSVPLKGQEKTVGDPLLEKGGKL